MFLTVKVHPLLQSSGICTVSNGSHLERGLHVYEAGQIIVLWLAAFQGVNLSDQFLLRPRVLGQLIQGVRHCIRWRVIPAEQMPFHM